MYEPYLKSQVYQTAEYKRLAPILRSGQSGSSSTSFEKGSTVADNDLYYAIHKCKYNYSQGRLTIEDVYDFQYQTDVEYGGLAGTAINTMYMAQVLGVIVPYTVKMNLVY